MKIFIINDKNKPLQITDDLKLIYITNSNGQNLFVWDMKEGFKTNIVTDAQFVEMSKQTEERNHDQNQCS